MKTPAPRKLRVPGKLAIQSPEAPPPAQPEPPPACVAPRRRFVKIFLSITGVLTLLGNLIFLLRCMHADWFYSPPHLILELFMGIGTMGMLEAPAFFLLLLPARTSRSSLFQLIGLALPLAIAIAACAFCGCDTDVAWGYGAFIALLSINGILFFYLPGCLLHVILHCIQLRRKNNHPTTK